MFFFNYNRINAGISNDAVEEHMASLFGPDRARKLRERVAGASPTMRESMILEEMTQAIKEMSGTFVLPFKDGSAACRAVTTAGDSRVNQSRIRDAPEIRQASILEWREIRAEVTPLA